MKLKLFVLLMIVFTITSCDNDNNCTHEWEWIVTTVATEDATGLETETCKHCDETRSTRDIPKIIPQPIPCSVCNEIPCECCICVPTNGIILKIEECGKTYCKHEGVLGQRLPNGVAVTNPDNVGNFADMIDEIELGISWLEANQQEYVYANLGGIRIVTGNTDAPSWDGNILVVGNDMGANDIWDKLDAWSTY
jgi:hypothetical protein